MKKAPSGAFRWTCQESSAPAKVSARKSVLVGGTRIVLDNRGVFDPVIQFGKLGFKLGQPLFEEGALRSHVAVTGQPTAQSGPTAAT